MKHSARLLAGLCALACSACSTEGRVVARLEPGGSPSVLVQPEMLAELMHPGDGLACVFTSARGDSLPVSISINRRRLERYAGRPLGVESHFFDNEREYDVRWSLPDRAGRPAYHYRLVARKGTGVHEATLDTVFLMDSPDGGRVPEDERLEGECRRGRIP